MYVKLAFLVCTFVVGAFGHSVIELDPDFEVMFHLTTVPNRIEIQVTARTTGWVGFGFSNTNSFTNADLVIGGFNDTNQSIYINDYWSTNSEAVPTLDILQNWYKNDTSCFQNTTHTRMYYYRLLDTGDAEQDLVIPDGNIYMLWSYGASDTLDTGLRKGVYAQQVNLVSAGSHGGSGSSVIQGSVVINLLCVGLYYIFVK